MSEWIRVEDQLPAELRSVLVAKGGFNVLNMYREGDHWHSDGLSGDICDKAEYRDITHWMPLPEPPK